MRNRCHSAKSQILTTISTKELDDVLLAAGQDRTEKDLEFIAKVILHTGIRPGELRDLTWGDVDLKNRFIKVHSKSGGTRQVPFGKIVRQLLLDRAKLTQESPYVLGKFPSAVLHRVLHRLKRVWRGTRATQVTFMSLRRSFAHRWMKAGGSEVALALMMGYASPATMKTLQPNLNLYEIAARFQRRLEDQS